MTVKSSKPLLRKIIVNQVKTNVAMMENDRFDGRKHLVNIGIVGCQNNGTLLSLITLRSQAQDLEFFLNGAVGIRICETLLLYIFQASL